MIAEAFLLCAMALPPTQFRRDVMTVGDVRALQVLGRTDDSKVRYTMEGRKVLLIMTPGNWLWAFRDNGIHAFRVTWMATSQFDVLGSILAVPVAKETMHTVIYGGASGHSRWASMQILSEAVYSVAQYGFFIFSERHNEHFSDYLRQKRYMRLPFLWRDFSIFQRTNGFKDPDVAEFNRSA